MSLVDPAAARARLVRPPGWQAPGPTPAGSQGKDHLLPRPGEDLSYLTGNWRIFQLKRGHRWSLDDMLTAWVALEEARAKGSVRRTLDLGCGIGSVLLMVAWGLPDARAAGIEAQERSVELCRRSIEYNGASERCEVHWGDLRDIALPSSARFDLITGTPPYLPIHEGIVSHKEQRGPCCFETRGGIEEYTEAALRYLAPDGVFVCCGGAHGSSSAGQAGVSRARDAAEAKGLVVTRQVEVIPREGKAPLLYVYAMRLRGENGDLLPAEATGSPPRVETSRSSTGSRCREERFVVRLRDGALSEQMHHARESMGLPPLRSSPLTR